MLTHVFMLHLKLIRPLSFWHKLRQEVQKGTEKSLVVLLSLWNSSLSSSREVGSLLTCTWEGLDSRRQMSVVSLVFYGCYASVPMLAIFLACEFL